MTRVILLLLLTTGEAKEIEFATEWECVKEAARYTEKGHQAWCLIRTPEEVGPLEKYPMTE